MVTTMSILWASLLLIVLLLDIPVYLKNDQATITATTRRYLKGPRSVTNTILSSILGGGFVWQTRWYDIPGDRAEIWWLGSVLMFFLMFLFAIDLMLFSLNKGLLKQPSTRQMIFGFVVGGLIIHFTGF